MLKASGRHRNVALPGIKALAYILCDIAARAVRNSSIVRTDFRAPAATPPQQEPSGIGSMIALPDGGGISRFLESLMMCLRAPLRVQGFWPTHECSAAGH